MPIPQSSSDARRAFGAAGERLTARYLEGRGYRILGRNVRLPGGEIDIVADHNGCLVLIEVRLRRGAGAGEALESVARRKQNRLRRLSKEYCATLSAAPESVRIDVVAVSLDRRGRVQDVLLIENAVEDE
ncbi:MAG TPA: YraN family protein [Dehalococcoidia bacterium]|nr:YraN family protein [Dehalococcoidia bacterium]